MIALYELPLTPDRPLAQADVDLRYEDIAQDGRLKLESLPHFMGVACWRGLVADLPGSAVLREHGIVPILSRLVIQGGDGPFSVRHAVTAKGTYQLAETRNAAGDVDRMLLNLYAEMRAPAGRTHGPPPPNAGASLCAGRVFAEHVFTKPFAPPAERKLVALPPGVHAGDFEAYAWRLPEDMARVPAGATALDGGRTPEPTSLTFGVAHTDSNQHVNSLVYPRIFEEAVLARLARMGRSTNVLLRGVELMYRKPCFVGDEVCWHMQLLTEGKELRVLGALLPASDPTGKPYCFVRAVLA